MYICNCTGVTSHLKTYYVNTRYITEQDQWPPVQPKHFTPLVVVHQEGQQSKKKIRDMASATMKGNIDKYISTASSKTTKDINEILSQLEKQSNGGKPRTLLIEGSPGIGKSVLLKQIAYLWATNKILTKSDFLFLLHLRDPAVQQMKSLECLVHHFYKSENKALSCISQLTQNDGQSVTILLDGYDELPAGLRKNSFIAHLFEQKELPASALVVSSRPHASTHLRENVICRVEILGFSEEDRTHFIEQSLEGNEDEITKLNNYLKLHPTIAGLCFVPFNMTILLFLFKQQATLPTRSSGLYNLFICLTICRHLAKSGKNLEDEFTDINDLPQPYTDIVKQFSKFAFNSLNQNQLVFSLDEIKKHCPVIVDYPNGFGLIQAVEYVGLMTKTRSFNFAHFSVQEFLAAHYITTVSADEELSILEEFFWSDMHYNTFNFYVALTSGQRSSFKHFLRSGNDTVTIDDKFLKDKLQRLRLYRIFHEAGDISTCKTIEGKYTDKIIGLRGTTLSPNSLEDLATLLTCSSCKHWLELDLNSCYIQDYGLLLLHRNLHNTSIRIDNLWLYNNDLTSSSDSCLSDIIVTCRVKLLGLGHNKALGETSQFSNSILTHPSNVEIVLMYSSNQTTTKWVEYFFSSLRKNNTVKSLSVSDNNISDDVCGAICEALAVNKTLKELYMHNNPITGEASKLIVDALKDNNTLKIIRFPPFAEDITKEIRLSQQIVNEMRRDRGFDVNLDVKF